MPMNSLRVGTVPLHPLRITVTDDADQPRDDLADYGDINLLLVGPDMEAIDTSAGTIVLDEISDGIVKYAWPAFSLFPTPGDYTLSLALLGPNSVEDYTEEDVVEVFT